MWQIYISKVSDQLCSTHIWSTYYHCTEVMLHAKSDSRETRKNWRMGRSLSLFMMLVQHTRWVEQGRVPNLASPIQNWVNFLKDESMVDIQSRWGECQKVKTFPGRCSSMWRFQGRSLEPRTCPRTSHSQPCSRLALGLWPSLTNWGSKGSPFFEKSSHLPPQCRWLGKWCRGKYHHKVGSEIA